MERGDILFLLLGIAAVTYAAVVVVLIIRDTQRKIRRVRDAVCSEEEREAVIEEWVRETTHRREMMGYAAVLAGLIGLLLSPGGIAGIWLPPLLAIIIRALRPVALRQQRGYARVLFAAPAHRTAGT